MQLRSMKKIFELKKVYYRRIYSFLAKTDARFKKNSEKLERIRYYTTQCIVPFVQFNEQQT